MGTGNADPLAQTSDIGLSQPRRFRSSSLIIVVCMAAGFLAAFLLYQSLPGRTKNELTQTPIPEAVIAIVGMDISDWFLAEPYLQTADGISSSWQWVAGEYAYASQTLRQPAELTTGAPCNDRRVASIRASAGPLVDCRTVETLGELCPGPIVSFGLAANGSLWAVSENQPCQVDLWVGLIVFVPAGLVLGLVLVVLNQLRLAIVRNRGWEAESHVY